MLRPLLVIVSFCALGATGCVTPLAQRAPLGTERGASAPPGSTGQIQRGTPPGYESPPSPPPPAIDERGTQLARWAATFVGLKSLRQVTHAVSDDCSGFVRFIYQKKGIELLGDNFLPGENGVSAIYRRARNAGALHGKDPRPGDLVFFHDTYDRNHDGRLDDGLTHVGIVESVDGEGTVTFIHRHGPGIGRSRFNPNFPAERHGPGGGVFNDYLRRATRRLRAYMAGELFSGYASPDRL